MQFVGFRAFTFDSNFGGDGWSVAEPYAQKLTFQLRELINMAHDFTYIGVYQGDDVRRRSHAEIAELAEITEGIIEKYRSEMREQETAASIGDQDTQYARRMLPTSVWLAEAFRYYREPMVHFPIQGTLKPIPKPLNVPEEVPKRLSEQEVNLFAAGALMDIDEGLYIAATNHGGDQIIAALDLFLGAADAVRSAAVAEFHIASEEGIDGRLTSGRARLLAAKRHEPTTRLKQRAIELYQAREWPSMLQAAKRITPELQAMAREMNATALRGDRAQQTVYEWIRAYAR